MVLDWSLSGECRPRGLVWSTGCRIMGRRSRSTILVCAWAVAALLLGVGCAPTTMLAEPKDWPAQIDERQVYHTPHAIIYASSAAAAGEADRLIAAVAREFAAQTDGKVGKGLVIVTDLGDETPAVDFDRLVVIVEHVRSGKASEQPDAVTVQQELHQVEQQMESFGLTMTTILGLTPMPLERVAITELFEIPEDVVDDVAWGGAIGTRAMVNDGTGKMMRAALKSKEIDMAARVILTPLLPVIQGVMADKMAKVREQMVFEQLADSQSGWTNDRKRQVIDAYHDQSDTMGQEWWTKGWPR